MGLSVAIVGAAGVGWALLPAHIRAQFTIAQIVTLLGFLAIMVGLMLAVGLSSVTADSHGLTIHNGPFTRRLAWGDIVGFRLRHGDPWAYALTDDPTDPRRVAMLGIQATDKQRAAEAVAWLREAGAESDA